jgi:peptide/nickel transport system substrate-binding protein
MSRGATALSLILVVAGIVLGWLIATGRAGASTGSRREALPRDQVLVTTGTAWGPESSFNPFAPSVTGTVGLCYETLLRYDPLKDEYIPWLAIKAGFKGKQYVITVRKGVKFSNGKTLTARMVVSDLKLGCFQTASWHSLWKNVKKIKVRGRTITVSFEGKPNYIQWQNLMWNLPIVYPDQFKSLSATNWTKLGSKAGFTPIGTGPYTVDREATASDGSNVVWRRRDGWWAAQQELEPKPKPKYIEDIGPCNQDFVLSCPYGGPEDLNNRYLPGIQRLVADGDVQTYYSEPPYHLPAYTVWLVPNTTHRPLGDPKFRRALAEAVSNGYIAGAGDYGGLVRSANATGLLPTWKKWIDRKQLKRLGFKYSITAAKATLAAAGYRDTDGDGYVENKDGSKLELTIEVPKGWLDWEAARNIIVATEKQAGIHLHVAVNDQTRVQTIDRNSGKFDLVLDSTYQISDNPWTYWNGIFHLPILPTQTFANFERYSNPKAWRLVKRLDRTPPSDRKTRKKLCSELEKIFLTELPAIPLWYGGAWAQWQTKHWKSWPSSTAKNRHFVPTMWNGYLQMTGIDMITHLKPA